MRILSSFWGLFQEYDIRIYYVSNMTMIATAESQPLCSVKNVSIYNVTMFDYSSNVHQHILYRSQVNFLRLKLQRTESGVIISKLNLYAHIV